MNKIIVRISFFVFSSLCFHGSSNAANVSENTMCLVSQESKEKPINLIFTTYTDLDLGKEVGGFVQYGKSKKIIPIVYVKSETNKASDPPDQETHWAEVINGKVTGEYVMVNSGAHWDTTSFYIYYQKYGSGSKKITFSALGANSDNADCNPNK